MKVKQLKEILDKYDDNVNVLMADMYPILRVVEVQYAQQLCLCVTDLDEEETGE